MSEEKISQKKSDKSGYILSVFVAFISTIFQFTIDNNLSYITITDVIAGGILPILMWSVFFSVIIQAIFKKRKFQNIFTIVCIISSILFAYAAAGMKAEKESEEIEHREDTKSNQVTNGNFRGGDNVEKGFKKSFKEQKDKGLLDEYVEHYDTLRNNYSNFHYGVSFDGNDNWLSNIGETEHSIFRTYQIDSALSFSIVVIESEIPSSTDVWKALSSNMENIKLQTQQQIQQMYNSTINNYTTKKTYLKGNLSLRTSFNYLIKDLNSEMDLTYISYQTIIDNLTFTFGLYVPTIFYEDNPEYYERIFGKIRFLGGKDK